MKNFESSMGELEDIVNKLERGELSLEESIEKYKRGIDLTKYCSLELKKVEKVIVEIMENDEKVKF